MPRDQAHPTRDADLQAAMRWAKRQEDVYAATDVVLEIIERRALQISADAQAANERLMQRLLEWGK